MSREQALTKVCEELVTDVEDLGVEYVREEWPDMAITYDHAKQALALGEATA